MHKNTRKFATLDQARCRRQGEHAGLDPSFKSACFFVHLYFLGRC